MAREETQSETIERLRAWVGDLQAGTYINCVYCGHRYGPDLAMLASMQDALKEHVEQCSEHPLFVAKTRLSRALEIIREEHGGPAVGKYTKGVCEICDFLREDDLEASQ